MKRSVIRYVLLSLAATQAVAAVGSVERKEMADLPLQVGLYHASYGVDSSYITFSGFRLTVSK